MFCGCQKGFQHIVKFSYPALLRGLRANPVFYGARSLRRLFAPTLCRSKGVYNPKAFVLHAASLGQAFAHCPIFLVAATRRCGNRVSVSLWGVMLSHPLPVIALVGHYPTNKLIGRRLLPKQVVTLFTRTLHENYEL